MLLNWSSAVTLKLIAVPAVAVPGAVTLKCVVVAAFTVMAPEVPLIVEVTVSVAVMVRLPVVFNVAENVPAPFVSVALAGNDAAASLLVKCTVPA